jgi:hypothetical protein
MTVTSFVTLLEIWSGEYEPLAAKASAGASNTAGLTAKTADATSGTTRTADTVLGYFVATTLLLMLSYFLPKFAIGLALIALTSTILVRGAPFWTIIASLTSPATSST